MTRVALYARYSSDHQVELAAAGIGQQGLNTRPQVHAGPGNGGVMVAGGSL
jgi:hypothetical protein